MNVRLFRKGLVNVIIFLVLGAAGAPCIVAEIQFLDSQQNNINESVELTCEIYGIEEAKLHTVKFSKEEAVEIENVFDNLKNELVAAVTREETIKLLNETVVSLHDYGLLPHSINIAEVQQLVTGRFLSKLSISILDNIYSKHQEIFDENVNSLCLITGKTSHTIFSVRPFTPLYLSSLAFGSLSYLCYVNGLTFLEGIFNMLLMTFFIPASLLFRMSVIFSLPLSVGSFVTFGYRTSDPVQNHYYPSEGWVWTSGLNGIKDWNDTFVGDVWFINSYYPPEVTKYYVGAVGFTGIKIGGGLNRDAFFLGTTLQVGFDTDYPYP